MHQNRNQQAPKAWKKNEGHDDLKLSFSHL